MPIFIIPANLYMHDAIFMPSLFHADKQIEVHISNAFSILVLLINLPGKIIFSIETKLYLPLLPFSAQMNAKDKFSKPCTHCCKRCYCTFKSQESFDKLDLLSR